MSRCKHDDCFTCPYDDCIASYSKIKKMEKMERAEAKELKKKYNHEYYVNHPEKWEEHNLKRRKKKVEEKVEEIEDVNLCFRCIHQKVCRYSDKAQEVIDYIKNNAGEFLLMPKHLQCKFKEQKE